MQWSSEPWHLYPKIQSDLRTASVVKIENRVEYPCETFEAVGYETRERRASDQMMDLEVFEFCPRGTSAFQYAGIVRVLSISW